MTISTKFTSSLVMSILFQQFVYAQKISTKENPTPYTIENCVNEFDLSKATKTKVGYQYWFANKKFTE